MPIFNNKPIVCPVHLNHAAADRARLRVQNMSLADLFDWSGNVAVDLAALVDQYRQGDEAALYNLMLADAMMHACVVELGVRSSR